MKTEAIAKSLALTTVLLYLTLAFGGVLSGHYFPLWGHISCAIAEFCFLTVVFYYEMLEASAVDRANEQKLKDAQASIKQYARAY